MTNENQDQQQMAENSQGQEQGQAGENQGRGDQPQEPESVRQANTAAQELAKQNERMEKNLKAIREENARSALGGKSDGKPQQQKPQLSDEEYAEKALSGQIPESKE